MRQPRGIPTGGQFAASALAEADVELGHVDVPGVKVPVSVHKDPRDDFRAQAGEYTTRPYESAQQAVSDLSHAVPGQYYDATGTYIKSEWEKLSPDGRAVYEQTHALAFDYALERIGEDERDEAEEFAAYACRDLVTPEGDIANIDFSKQMDTFRARKSRIKALASAKTTVYGDEGLLDDFGSTRGAPETKASLRMSTKLTDAGFVVDKVDGPNGTRLFLVR